MSNINVKDLGTGMLFIGIGLSFALYALMTLELGRVGNMGPGYFPVLLGSTLAALGTVLALRSVRTARDPIGNVPWMGLLLVTLSIGFFGLAIRPLGVAVAFFGATMLGCFATGRIKPLEALLTSLALTVGCIVVFIYLLGLPYPVFGPWIRGY